ncbi:hypothetical protein [Nakamurella panacisegetis]|uniref:hypothetical protein n=1 Tax=Nakamurella panacisegetis TaxID=1090615 RepID=UPI0012FD5ED9|nr:hypothetical protein [Nakamurella panacisegetis]
MSAVALALALWLWPASGVRSKPARAIARTRRPVALRRGRVLFGAVILGVGTGAVVGPVVGTATALLSATLGLLAAAELRRRRVRVEVAALLAALRTLAREVRAGAQPVAAIAATATSHRDAGPALHTLTTAVTSGRLPVGAQSPPAGPDVVSATAERLVVGWALSARHGVPWATLIDATVADLADRVRTDTARAAQVAGPRVSGYVLAVLPALGLLLGAGMGADPVHVLLDTAVGNLLLLLGSTLTCAGLAWTARIVRT